MVLGVNSDRPLPEPDVFQLFGGDVCPYEHALGVCNLEQRLAYGNEFSLLCILLQYCSGERSLHESMGNLVVYLCLLGADACLLGGYASLLRADSVYLCGYSLVLFCQCGVLAGYLFGGGSELFAQHFNLIVDVIDLLPGNCAVFQQLCKALTLTLLIHYLLSNSRYLLLQIELTAACCLPVGSQLTLVCIQLSVCSGELFIVSCQLMTL